MNKIIKLLLLSGILAASNVYAGQSDDSVKTPFKLAKGKFLFEKNCSTCHGKDLRGTKQGPPFIHRFYKPSHHGDAAFYRAALKGVTAHHWRYGNMPPVKGITESKLKSIISYVRFYQKQKNLF